MYVYFIQSGGDGPIKIGKTSDVWARLRKMQTDSAAKLQILSAVETLSEGEIHARFAHLRRDGEWFPPAPDLIAFVSTLPAFVHPPKSIPENAHPLLRYLSEAGIPFDRFAEMTGERGRKTKAIYVGHIVHGHSRPHWLLANAMSAATDGAVTTDAIMTWPGYRDRSKKRSAA